MQANSSPLWSLRSLLPWQLAAPSDLRTLVQESEDIKTDILTLPWQLATPSDLRRLVQNSEDLEADILLSSLSDTTPPLSFLLKRLAVKFAFSSVHRRFPP